MNITCIRFLTDPECGDERGSISHPYPHHMQPGTEGFTGGTRIGNFEVLSELGRGTSGTVYKAWHPQHHQQVALKLFRHGITQSAQIRRLFREVRIARRLNHPRIAPVHALHDHHGRPFLVMKYFEGGNLAQLLRVSPPSLFRAARILEILSDAVHHAHLEGVFHRDLKPSNILLDACGNPSVGDFGVAKDAESGGDLPVTLEGEILGTPNYMSPEQAEARHEDIGPWSDVYSLGAILYELLTGRPPFVGTSIREILNQVTHQDPSAPSGLNPNVPKPLEIICLKCLSKAPNRRYTSALALKVEIRRYLDNLPILARAPVKTWEQTLWL